MKFKMWTDEQIDYLKDNYGKISAEEIGLKINRSARDVMNKAYLLKIKSTYKKQNKTWQEKLAKTNIKMISDFTKSKNKHEFICPYCNNIFKAQFEKIISFHTRSCGCVKGPKRKLGSKYLSQNHLTKIEYTARIKQLDYNLTSDYLDKLLEEQDFRCNLSGVELTFGLTTNKKITASLDRIDSKLGYIEGNVQWLHKDVNYMKQEYSQEYYIDICKKVANNARN